MISKTNLTALALVLVFAFASINISQAFDQPTVGPNAPAWDGDFQTNILGNNNDSNKFSSANVVENADGSILERLQFIQSKLTANPVFDDKFTIADDPSTPNSVFQFLTAKVGEYKTAMLKIGDDENSLLNALKITSDGSNQIQVGVGVDTPSASLDVNGNIRMRALDCSTETNGGKLTATADGTIICAADNSTSVTGDGADNTGSSLSSGGEDIYTGMQTDALKFRGLKGGNGISLTSSTTDITASLDEVKVDEFATNETTANYIPKSDGDSLVDSVIQDNGSDITIGSPATANHIGLGTSSPGTTFGAGTSKALDIASTDFAEVVLDHTDASDSSDIGRLTFARNNIPLATIHSRADGATDAASIIFHTQETGGALTEAMRIASNGDVGIGPTSPQAKLHTKTSGDVNTLIVEASTNNEFPVIVKNGGGSAKGLLISGGASTGELLTVSNFAETQTHFTIKDGNVGIGTPNPGTKLQVYSEQNPETDSVEFVSSFSTIGDGVNAPQFAAEIALKGSPTESDRYVDFGAVAYNNAAWEGSVAIGKIRNRNVTIGNDHLYVKNTGNIGIGTSDPFGALEIENASGNTLTLSKSNAEPYIQFGLNDSSPRAAIDSIAAGGLRFYTGNGALAEAMNISADGKVGVGTTAVENDLEVSGSSVKFGNGPGMTLKLHSDVNNISINDNKFGFNTTQAQGFVFNGGPLVSGLSITTAARSTINPNTSQSGFGDRYYADASSSLSFKIQNSSLYRVTIRSADNSTSATLGQYIIYGLNKSGGSGTDPEVQIVTEHPSGIKWTFGPHAGLNAHDTSFVVNCIASAGNQGCVAVVEKLD